MSPSVFSSFVRPKVASVFNNGLIIVTTVQNKLYSGCRFDELYNFILTTQTFSKGPGHTCHFLSCLFLSFTLKQQTSFRALKCLIKIELD